MKTDDEKFREFEEMLPWHAARTLNRRDALRLEAALAQNPELVRRYELVREELTSTINLNEMLGAPSVRAMETLFDKIDVKPARRYVSAHHVVARILAFFSELSPRTLAWSAGAASLIILLQLGLLGGVVFTQQSGGSYQTASAPAAMPARGAFVLIQFVPQASAGEITKFLQSNNASIVGGPFTGGFYRVRVAASALPKEQLDELVKRMQQEKSIGFVLPGK